MKQELFIAEVQDLASDGRGVVRHPNGQVYFVAGVWPGEYGEFKVIERGGRVGVAALTELQQASEHRIEPPCPHFSFSINQGGCGGCPWQFVDYTAQLSAKYERVRFSAARIAAADKVKPIISSPKTWAYRNRAQFKTDGIRLGYLAAKSNKLVDVSQCAVLTEKNQDTLAALRHELPKEAWRPRGKKFWHSIDIDETTKSSDAALNQRLPFKQANFEQNLQMKGWLAEKFAMVEDRSTVLELFCGSGNFTEILVDTGFKKILAAEVSAEAMTQLMAVNLPGVEAFVADLFSKEALSELVLKAREASVLVLDPPRDGLKVCEPLLQKGLALQDIFYISCDLATFFRDIADFQSVGFELLEIQPLDLFPQTPHIEVMAALKRAK